MMKFPNSTDNHLLVAVSDLHSEVQISADTVPVTRCPPIVQNYWTEETVLAVWTAVVFSLTRRRMPHSACKVWRDSPAFYPLIVVPGPKASAWIRLWLEARETTAPSGISTRRETAAPSCPWPPPPAPAPELRSRWSSPVPSWWRWGRRWPGRGGRRSTWRLVGGGAGSSPWNSTCWISQVEHRRSFNVPFYCFSCLGESPVSKPRRKKLVKIPLSPLLSATPKNPEVLDLTGTRRVSFNSSWSDWMNWFRVSSVTAQSQSQGCRRSGSHR